MLGVRAGVGKGMISFFSLSCRLIYFFLPLVVFFASCSFNCVLSWSCPFRCGETFNTSDRWMDGFVLSSNFFVLFCFCFCSVPSLHITFLLLSW
ncbi:hypothetical protein BZA05DRAFT_391119 [Tricharina praecox]|uniref:uncharacterized protein n=1 Tax=Tricharina praecox TaxID=43433 RepID=UPI00221F8DD3|nr:uncharacterized protein BZA05DRAFT_391119 [Tricharina praecox]KAI5855287.1 hypothetical protein BZA05DRAFT_391119 [Tricharina praecox]